MPRTRLERVVAVAGLVVTLALAALVVPAWLDYRDRKVIPASGGPEPTERMVTRAVEPREPAFAKPVSQPATRPPKTHVILDATRGSCWLLIRKGSAAGTTLYEGVLGEGSRLTFTGDRLWIRMGAGENLEITVDGQRVDEVPRGVADVVASPSGVRRL